MSGQSPQFPAITERLAERLERPVAQADRARAALHVLDWAGCAAAGAAEPAGRAAARFAAMEAAGPCTVLGAAPRSAAGAALVNGMLGNVLEMDDVDKRAILHPGPSVIPAALAVAESSPTPGGAARFLDGVVRGYEAVIRLGRAVGPEHYRYWHNTGTCGPLGAAAAAASILGLDRDQTADALGLAGTQASGFWQTRHEPRSMAKQLHTGRAAHAGVVAAQLAYAGMAGPRRILEGPQGFFAATCGNADAEAVVAFDEGALWALHEVSFKPWPACRHAHAAIDAALILRADGVRAEDVEAVSIATYADAATFCDKPEPTSVIEAKFSLQHAVVVALMDGPPAMTAFEPSRIEDAATRTLRGRASVVVTDPYASGYPARYGSGVTVRLSSGEERCAHAPDALGDPENPLTLDALVDKARGLMAWGGVPAISAERLIEAAVSLAEADDISRFTNALGALHPVGAEA